MIEFPDLDLVVWGRAMEEHTPSFQPLAHIPTRHDQRWHIAMAHGFFYATRQQPDRSSPIFADEIRDTGWDYVALGHQHVLTDVSQGQVTAYYSGAPLVDWTGETPNGCTVSPCSISAPEHGVPRAARAEYSAVERERHRFISTALALLFFLSITPGAGPHPWQSPPWPISSTLAHGSCGHPDGTAAVPASVCFVGKDGAYALIVGHQVCR